MIFKNIIMVYLCRITIFEHYVDWETDHAISASRSNHHQTSGSTMSVGQTKIKIYFLNKNYFNDLFLSKLMFSQAFHKLEE